MANFIDKVYLQSFWNHIKGIITNSKYTLNNKSQTVQDAIDDLGTNKQDKLIPGFGIEIQDDNTIDAEVEYEDVENHFEESALKIPNNGSGNHIFYTKNGTIYYMHSNTFCYLNRLNNTWVELDATTCPGNGQETWMDYDGTIRLEKYKLNENTNTWSLDSNEQVSIGYGHTVYTDYNGILRSSSAGVARTRNISTLQWETDADQTGPYNSYGTWFDYNGIIHCGEYSLNKSTGLWESDSTGIGKTVGGAIEDNNGILHYFYGQTHQILDKETNTWVDEPLVGVLATDRFYGNQFWTDYQGNLHFGKYLFITKNRGYITRHNDRLQLKLIPGNGVNIDENNVISIIPSDASADTQSQLTPGFGIEIDENDTILAEVEYFNQNEGWRLKDWGINNIDDGQDIWKLGDDIYYSQGDIQYKFNRVDGTFHSYTWPGSLKPNYGRNVWTDGTNIYYSEGTTHYILRDGQWYNKTWNWNIYDSVFNIDIPPTNYEIKGQYIWHTPNGRIFHTINNNGPNILFELKGDTWYFDWHGNESLNTDDTGAEVNAAGNFVSQINNRTIYPSRSTYYHEWINDRWIRKQWTTPISSSTWNPFNVIVINNALYYIQMYDKAYKLNDNDEWIHITLDCDEDSKYYASQGIHWWTIDDKTYCSYVSTTIEFIDGKNGYFTRHNDELQTKLKAGDNITISNGVISAIGGDLSNYYNKTEVDNKISAIPKFSISVVSTLPTTNISTTTVYLVANTTTQTQNLYTEYIYVNSKWEKLGEQTIDLSGYATTTALNAKQDSLTTAQLSAVNSGITSTKVSTYDGYATSIGNKVDKASGKGLSTNDYTTTEKNKLAGIAENANNYSHPTYTSKTSGLYKITVDGTGHVSGTAAVTASDLPSHSHTGYLTSETDPVFSASAAAGITSEDITNWNAKGTSNLTLGTTATTAAAGNHTHSYLPLSGGTLTGTVGFDKDHYITTSGKGAAIDLNNGDIIGVNSIYTNDNADNTAEGIRFYRDSTHYDTLTASGGVLYFKPNDTASGVAFTDTSVKKVEFQGHTHSNYVAKAGDTMTGPLNINTGASHTEYNQGLRINANASNGWGLVMLGCPNNSTSGTDASGWIIGRRGTDAPSGGFGQAGDLCIQANGSDGTTGMQISRAGHVCTSGGISTKSGVRVGAQNISSGSITGGCYMQYNATNKCLEFTF